MCTLNFKLYFSTSIATINDSENIVLNPYARGCSFCQGVFAHKMPDYKINTVWR